MALEPCTIEEEYRALVEASQAAPVVVFKHSTRCPISAAANREMTRYAEAHPEVRCGLVLVVEQRPLSLLIAQETGITHQSPQVLVLRNGSVVWNASHYNITAAHVEEAVVGAG